MITKQQVETTKSAKTSTEENDVIIVKSTFVGESKSDKKTKSENGDIKPENNGCFFFFNSHLLLHNSLK